MRLRYSVFAIFKSRKLNLKGDTAPLIEVESGSNDPMAPMLTLAMISVLNGKGEGMELVWDVLLEIVLGVGLGLLLAKSSACCWGMKTSLERSPWCISSTV